MMFAVPLRALRCKLIAKNSGRDGPVRVYNRLFSYEQVTPITHVCRMQIGNRDRAKC